MNCVPQERVESQHYLAVAHDDSVSWLSVPILQQHVHGSYALENVLNFVLRLTEVGALPLQSRQVASERRFQLGKNKPVDVGCLVSILNLRDFESSVVFVLEFLFLCKLL